MHKLCGTMILCAINRLLNSLPTVYLSKTCSTNPMKISDRGNELTRNLEILVINAYSFITSILRVRWYSLKSNTVLNIIYTEIYVKEECRAEWISITMLKYRNNIFWNIAVEINRELLLNYEEMTPTCCELILRFLKIQFMFV